MLTSMVGRNSPRPQLPSGAPPGNMPGVGGIHRMIAQAMQAQPQGAPMPPPAGMPGQAPQGMPMPQGVPPAGMPQGRPPMMNPRNAMMAQALRGG